MEGKKKGRKIEIEDAFLITSAAKWMTDSLLVKNSYWLKNKNCEVPK